MKMQVYHQHIQQLIELFENTSLISNNLGLIASKEAGIRLTTTSRLVTYQIIKKYMQPSVGDLFILNDPENGGFGYKTLFFIAALTTDLFLVWTERTLEIDFKIPPTPIFEKSAKNKFVWELLVDQNPEKEKLSTLFTNAFEKYETILKNKELLSLVSDAKKIQSYFKDVKLIYDRQFNHLALGQSELSYRIPSGELIKFKLLIDDKANLKSMIADFSQTSLAGSFSCASHIIESALVHKICSFYEISNYLSQPILDNIKMILPPKSVVAKASNNGKPNLYLQRLTAEMVAYHLKQINSTSRTKQLPFAPINEFHYELKFGHKIYDIYGTPKNFRFLGLDDLICGRQVNPNKIQFLDQKISIDLDIISKHFSFVEKFYLGNRPEIPFVSNSKIQIDWTLS